MSFLPIAILGYLLTAVSVLVDKFLVDRSIPHPIVYTFYLGILSLSALALVPFGFYFPDQAVLILAFFSGISFVLAWLMFYSVLKFDEASRVSPIVGALNSLFTLTIGFLFFAQVLSGKQVLASLILILGLVVLSSTSWSASWRLKRQHILLMISSAVLFAVASVLLREVFLKTTFINGLILTRIAMAATACCFLIIPEARKFILQGKITRHHFVNKTSLLFMSGQLVGALGGLLITYAIFLVNPAIVSATQGVQYLLILIVILLLSKKYQHLLEEQLTRRVILQKVFGAILIALGLWRLASS